jgi:hypothetical protein
VDELTTTQGIVALAAGGVAIVTLLFAIVLGIKLRRMRRAQRAVMGEAGQRDLVSHSARLEQGFTELRDWLEESMESLERRMEGVEARVDGCVAHRALVRYDAYNELSGHQSSSIALLDAHRSGVIITSIVHRDQARLYVKQLQEGESEIPLSPEEQQAVDSALAAPVSTS